MAGMSKRLEAAVAPKGVMWKISSSYPTQRRYLPLCAHCFAHPKDYTPISWLFAMRGMNGTSHYWP